MIKITGGKFKQKKLESISNYVRPTSSFKREAIFSIIESYTIKHSINLYKNKTFLDLFAGIGTMGLEAVSRGMCKVIFFENNSEVIKVLKKNCLTICMNKEFTIYEEDVINSNLEINFKNISIIYIDPPYQKYNLTKLLINLKDKVQDTTIIALEASIKDSVYIPKGLNLFQKKNYGNTTIYFLKLF